MITALAFVPVDNVRAYYHALLANMPHESLLPVADDFAATYIGRTVAGRYMPPRYEISMWNVYDSVNDDLPRTNNAVEGWHSCLAVHCGKSNMNFWAFIDVLKEEEGMARVDRTHVEAGRPPANRRHKYVAVDKRIRNIVNKYFRRTEVDYLKGISHNIRISFEEREEDENEDPQVIVDG